MSQSVVYPLYSLGQDLGYEALEYKKVRFQMDAGIEETY